MRDIVCFGELLIDFLSVGKHQEQEVTLNDYRQFPGGAPANVAVAVAKLGGKACFVGQVGDDYFGRFLEKSLLAYQVNTRFLSKHISAKTALAFVQLDEAGERSFSFYRDKTADVMLTKEQVSASWFEQASIFHFCSNTLTDSNIAATTLTALSLARARGLLVSLDVNLRENLWPNKSIDLALVNQCVMQSHVVKFSREEVEELAGEQSISTYVNTCLQAGPKFIVITNGGKSIECYSLQGFFQQQPPKVDVIDTTAGGDAFCGGLLFALGQCTAPLSDIKSSQFCTMLVNFAAACGGVAVSKLGAFPALATIDEVIEQWRPIGEYIHQQISK